MQPPPITDTLAATTGAATYLGWVLIIGIVNLVAVVRILREPGENWKHRNRSKFAWAAQYVAPPLPGDPLPVGAIADIWRTRRRRDASTSSDLLRAGRSPEWPLPWRTK